MSVEERLRADAADSDDDDGDMFLPVTMDQLVEAMCSMTSDTKQQEWRAMMEGLGVVVGVYYDAIARRLRAGMEGTLEDNEARDQFLVDLLKILSSAQYSVLSEETFDGAMDGQYSFKFPCDVDWTRFHTETLSTFYKRHLPVPHNSSLPQFPHAAAPLPSYADKMLILTRGCNKVTSTEYFIDEKLNLCTEVMYAKLKAMVGLGKKKAEAAPSAEGAARPRKRSLAQHTVDNRVTLEDHSKERGLFNVFFKQVTIMEPTFEDAVIIYWPSVAGEAAKKAKGPGSPTLTNRKDKTAGKKEVMKTAGDVVVAHYSGIPFGDLEGCFPFKFVNLRPFDFLQVLVYATMAVVVIGMTLHSILTEDHDDDGGLVLLQLFLAVVLKNASEFYYYYTNLKVAYQRQVGDWEQAHNKAKGIAVVSRLMDDVKDQELKEVSIAYFLLWVNGPSSFKDLDKQAETFLKDKFGLDRNFDVEDAVAKLLNLKLIGKDSKGLHHITVTPAEWVRQVPTSHITSLKLKSD